MGLQGSRRRDNWFGTLLDEVREHCSLLAWDMLTSECKLVAKQCSGYSFSYMVSECR